jgi:ferredoxin
MKEGRPKSNFFPIYNIGDKDKILLVAATEYDPDVIAAYAEAFREKGARVDVFTMEVESLKPELCAAEEARALVVALDNPCYTSFCNIMTSETVNSLIRTERYNAVVAGTARHGSCVSACPYGALSLYDSPRTQYREGPTPLDQATKQRFKLRTGQKCAVNVNRTNRGLDPACVVVCPTQCRIFGDLDDPNSKPNKYLAERRGTPLSLLPALKTKSNVVYLN